MLILFDFENIQNTHYRDTKQLIVDKIGYTDWVEAKNMVQWLKVMKINA